MKLVILARQKYEDYFRKQLLEVAEQQGTPTLYVALLPQNNKIDLVRHGNIIASYDYYGPMQPIINSIAEFAGTDRLVLLHSSAYANAWKVLQLRVKFCKAHFVFDVFDDYFYDARGFKLTIFKILDYIYSRLSSGIIVLSKDLSNRRYPGAFHLDNASHILPSTSGQSDICSRVVVIASFDRRLNWQWLQRLVHLAPDIQFDLYGWVHAGDKTMELTLQSIISDYPNLVYRGAYQNSNLANILVDYQIGLIPYFAEHKLTQYINPDKIYHYLCAGMEVISTPIPQAIRMQQYLHICPTPEDAACLIHQLLLSKQRKNPRQLYLKFSWMVRWNELNHFFENLINDV